jgi:hypothetical protein
MIVGWMRMIGPVTPVLAASFFLVARDAGDDRPRERALPVRSIHRWK